MLLEYVDLLFGSDTMYVVAVVFGLLGFMQLVLGYRLFRVSLFVAGATLPAMFVMFIAMVETVDMSYSFMIALVVGVVSGLVSVFLHKFWVAGMVFISLAGTVVGLTEPYLDLYSLAIGSVVGFIGVLLVISYYKKVIVFITSMLGSGLLTLMFVPLIDGLKVIWLSFILLLIFGVYVQSRYTANIVEIIIPGDGTEGLYEETGFEDVVQFIPPVESSLVLSKSDKSVAEELFGDFEFYKKFEVWVDKLFGGSGN